MARGAWIRAMTPPVLAAGVDIDSDPYGLLDHSSGNTGVLEYDDDVYRAMYGEKN